MNLFSSVFNWLKPSQKKPSFHGFKTEEEKNDFEKIEREFLLELRQIYDDIQRSIRVLGEIKPPLIKSQLCMVFICADTFSRIFKILEGCEISELDNSTGKRFKKWFTNFVFTCDNEAYRMHKNKIKCNAEIAWQLRNAALHFYGLPDFKKTGGKRIFYFNGNEREIELLERKYESIGEDVGIINHAYFSEAVLRGLLVQLNSMKKMINERPNHCIERIKIAHEILRMQGAKVTQVK